MFIVLLVIVPLIGSVKIQQFVTNLAETAVSTQVQFSDILLPSPFWCNDRHDLSPVDVQRQVPDLVRTVFFSVEMSHDIPVVALMQIPTVQLFMLTGTVLGPGC